ncbi:MAG TPA: DMT family transporter [Rhodospirillales bacterium]|nr:DMT family transporter [Rhodospirillales bacterium]
MSDQQYSGCSSDAPLRGALWMLVAGIAFAAMTALIRHQTTDMHPFEVAFFRNLFGLAFMLPWFWRSGLAGLKTNRLGLHGFRAAIGLGAMSSWFVAVSMMPVAEATALSFTAPLFATIGAALFLGEVVRARRWLATLVGFVGVLIILRPGDMELGLPAVLALVASAFMSMAALTVKVLSRTEKASAIVFYMGLIMTPLSLIPALFYWTAPVAVDWLWFMALGLFATIGQLAMVRAFASADISAVLPFDFFRLVFAAILGYLIFSEQPDQWTWVGAAIIFAATLYTAHREAKGGKPLRPARTALRQPRMDGAAPATIRDQDPASAEEDNKS